MPPLLLRDGRPRGAGGPVELGGRIVPPGLVEAHCRLDKTRYGGAKALGLGSYGLTEGAPRTSWWSTRRPRPTPS